MTTLFTIGYQDRTLDELLTTLSEAGVKILVDVRELPLSRKPGFSKTALGNALEKAGLRYVHLRELGTPRHIRKSPTSVKDRMEQFDEHMEKKGWDDALRPLFQLLDQGPCCLLCFERHPDHCHRTPVARAVLARRSDVKIRPL